MEKKTAEMFHGLRLPVIEFEGEKYYLTIPLSPLVSDIGFPFSRDDRFISFQFQEVELIEKMDSFILYDESFFASSTKQVLQRRINTYKRGAKDDSGNLLKQSSSLQLWNFRLMLVPLDRDGQIDLSFEKSNQNGDVFRSGYLKIKQDGMNTVYMGQRRTGLYAENPIHLNGVSSLQMVSGSPDDPQGKECLEWIFWDGFLITSRSLFCLTLQEADRLGILPN